MADLRVVGLVALVLAVAAGIYVFFQNAPDAHLYARTAALSSMYSICTF